VERIVPYVRESFWAGRDFSGLDLEEINRELLEWCLKVAGQRIHGTIRQRPLEVFLAVEKPTLKPLPRDPFESATWYWAKVGDDCHVYVANGGYSIPYQYRGELLDVRVARRQVECFLDHELVKTHCRVEKGKRSTDWNDYPPEKGAFFSRTPDWCRAKAAQMGRASAPGAIGILRLGEKYGASRLDAACCRALEFGDPRYRTIKNILEKGLDKEIAMAIPSPALARAFLRGPEELFAPITEIKEVLHDQSASSGE